MAKARPAQVYRWFVIVACAVALVVLLIVRAWWSYAGLLATMAQAERVLLPRRRVS
jgi:hypothetical protein